MARRFLLVDWVSQNTLISHPNLKLVIHHGGYNTLMESAYHGKPAIVVPLAADQETNALIAVSAGIGARLDKLTVSADEIYHTVPKLLDHACTARVQQVSAILRQRNATTEVARLLDLHLATNGSQHLVDYRSMHRHWFVEHSFDLVVGVGACLFVAVSLVWWILHALLSRYVLSLGYCRMFAALQVLVFSLVLSDIRNGGYVVRFAETCF
jgi:ceramide galactosyltransferase